MGFFENYKKICEEKGIEPCSQQAADMFGVTRAILSIWNTKHKIPKGETIKIIADKLCVSADYLLDRTDDPTDYTNPDLIAEQAGSVLDHFDGDVKKAIKFHEAIDNDVKSEKPRILNLYNQLNYDDKIRVEAYIEGMLTKYPTQGKRTTA